MTPDDTGAVRQGSKVRIRSVSDCKEVYKMHGTGEHINDRPGLVLDILANDGYLVKHDNHIYKVGLDDGFQYFRADELEAVS